MAEISLDTNVKLPIQAVVKKTARLFYIDNLRSLLIILVVLHHIALVYGASLEGYYYVEPPFTEPSAFRNLLAFAMFNQAWHMGAFFLLAGYFTPGSFDRKGVGSFVKVRLIRLGIPMLIFYFILQPISFIGWFLMPESLTGISSPLTLEIFWQMYPDLIGLGPLWFVAMLLVFSFGYVGWRMLRGERTVTETADSSFPNILVIGLFIVGLAVANYLMRIVVPLGESVWDFPSLAYLPQYLSFYILGIVAYRKQWLKTLPNSLGVAGFVAAVIAIVALFPLAFSGEWLSMELTDTMENGLGNGHWQSAVYGLWDSIVAVGMVLGLVVLFRRFVNGVDGFGRFLSTHSYTVYIIHIPLVVFLAYAIRNTDLEPLPKFGLASLIIVPTCFIVAYLVRSIPGANRIL